MRKSSGRGHSHLRCSTSCAMAPAQPLSPLLTPTPAGRSVLHPLTYLGATAYPRLRSTCSAGLAQSGSAGLSLGLRSR